MTKKEALKQARELKNLLGKGWKPRVWENPKKDWNCEATAGNLSIYFNEHGQPYNALLGDDSPHAGNGCWSTNTNGSRTPRAAAIKEVKSARRQVNKCLASVAAAEKVLGINRVTIKQSKPKKLPSGWKQVVQEIKVDGKPFMLSIQYTEPKKEEKHA